MTIDSAVETMARLPAVENKSLAEETPVLAAGLSFVRENGGPSSGRFIEVLPDDWYSDRVVIDSTLVWLQKHRSPGPRFFHHEPFPGAREGAKRDANRERDVEHIACCMGRSSPDEFLIGPIDQQEARINTGDDSRTKVGEALRSRHERLRNRVSEGKLSVRTVPIWSTFRFGWGDFRRFPRSTHAGFHFRIRATRNTDRPVCNLIRNSSYTLS